MQSTMKVSYEIYDVKVTLEVPLGAPEIMIRKIVDASKTMMYLEKTYESIKKEKK